MLTLLPEMSSNNLPSPFTIAASSSLSNAWTAFNSNTDYWEPASSANTEYLEIDLGIPTVVNTLAITCSSGGLSLAGIMVQASNNATTFTTLVTFNSLAFTAGIASLLTFSNNIAYRYYRLVLVNQNSQIARIQYVQIGRQLVITSVSDSSAQSRFAEVVQATADPLLQIIRTPVSIQNISVVNSGNNSISTRPTQGQIFPRGLSLASATIQYNPITAPNLVNYTANPTGFKIAAIAVLSGSIYDSDLASGCNLNLQWKPHGTFCNTLYPDDQSVFWKTNADSGATWQNTPGTTVGVLVLDLGASTAFNDIKVFQKFSSGKVTHTRAFIHGSTSSTAPLHTDTSWVPLANESVIGPGSTGYNGLRTSDASIISLPTAISFPEATSRYIKLEFRNTGLYGSSGWLEVGGIKIFNL